MLDTIQKLTYRAKANIPNAAAALKERLCDRRELSLAGIHGERLFLTVCPNWSNGLLSFRFCMDNSPPAEIPVTISFWMPGLLHP